MHTVVEPIPADHPVQPLARDEHPRHYDEGDGRWIMHDVAECGHCGLRWDDSISTSLTPVPSGRCPFEWYHLYDESEV